MNFVRRMTAGRGIVRRSERTTLSWSASTISAFPSITRRRARRIGTMVRGSNDAFRAKQPTTTQTSVIRRARLARQPELRGGRLVIDTRHLSFQTTNGTVGRYEHN